MTEKVEKKEAKPVFYVISGFQEGESVALTNDSAETLEGVREILNAWYGDDFTGLLRDLWAPNLRIIYGMEVILHEAEGINAADLVEFGEFDKEPFGSEYTQN